MRPKCEHDVPLAVGFDSKPESLSRLVKACCVGPYLSLLLPSIPVNLDACLTDQAILVTGHARNIFTRSTPFNLVKWVSFEFHQFFFLKHLRTQGLHAPTPNTPFDSQLLDLHLIPQHRRASHKSIIAMFGKLSSCLVTLLLASQGSAHFYLNYPPSIGFDDSLEGTPPCGSFTPDPSKDNVTNYYVGGTSLALV